MNIPPYPRTRGNKGKLTNIHNVKKTFIIEEEISCWQGKAPYTKRIYLQQIRHDDDKRLEYRFTYYMLGVKPEARDRWVFGQYSMMIPEKELAYLLRTAKKKGWAGF